MKKLILIGMILAIFTGCAIGQDVSIRREIITNYVSPNAINWIYSTNMMVNSVTNVISSIYCNPYLEDIERKLDKANRTITELTYPKTYNDIKWVWSNTIYTVTEKNNPTVEWTNSVCIKKVITDTIVKQFIRTNINVKVEDLEIKNDN